MNFVDYMNIRLPYANLTYNLDKIYDNKDSLEVERIKSKMISAMKRDRIVPFISACLFIVSMSYFMVK